MVKKILILGGTKEAAELATTLATKGHDVTTSLAGRTKQPKPLAGKVRTGGFSDSRTGSIDGLANYLLREGFDRLIDATHPFAKQISQNAPKAATIAGIEFETHQRPAWKSVKGDHWLEVSSLEEAVDKIPVNASVLLALGSQHIGPFSRRRDVHFVVRMVDEPVQPLTLSNYELVLGLPSTHWQEEACLLTKNAITHIVCRNSGGQGAYAKIEAARKLELPVIMIA